MKNFLQRILTVILLFASTIMSQAQAVRIAVAGTTHGHSGWILGKKDTTDVVIAGIYEKNTQLTANQAKQFGLRSQLFFTDLQQMLDQVKPEAVVAFGSIYDHLQVVEACAPR